MDVNWIRYLAGLPTHCNFNTSTMNLNAFILISIKMKNMNDLKKRMNECVIKISMQFQNVHTTII